MVAFLLASLTKSISNVVHNIQTKQDVIYENVRQRLQNLQAETPLTGDNRLLHLRNTPKPNGKECTWWMKKNQPYQGDEYKEYRKLKEKNKKRETNRRIRGRDNSSSVIINESCTTVCMVCTDTSPSLPLTCILDSVPTSHVKPFKD